VSLRDDARRPDEAHFTRRLSNVRRKNERIKMKAIVLTALMIACSTVIFADKEKEEVVAKVYCKASTIRFRNDAEANPGLNNLTYCNVPKKYSGWRVTYRKSASSKESLNFKVKKAGIVTVISWDQVNRYLKQNGWKEVDRANVKTGTGEQEYNIIIFEKYLDAGQYELKFENKNYGPPRLLKK
jgi:hypothetical protein